MKYQVIEPCRTPYLLMQAADGSISSEKDIADLLSACFEQDIFRILLPDDCLSDDFYKLSTKLAGNILQKLINYRVKTAVVMNADRANQRFKEFMIEINKGRSFRCFETMDEAEKWLLLD